ncbi:MAG: hypothetical protein AVDCRST_MAG25-2679, partial [uncultured Rubrobacteraceae bacterium]
GEVFQTELGGDHLRATLRRQGQARAGVRGRRGVQVGPGACPSGGGPTPEERPRPLPPEGAHPGGGREGAGTHPPPRRGGGRGRRAARPALGTSGGRGEAPRRPRRAV